MRSNAVEPVGRGHGRTAVEPGRAYGRASYIGGSAQLDRGACDTDLHRMTDPRATTLDLLARRAAGATVCPSEVARALSPEDWRDVMPLVHAAVDELVRDGSVRLTWKGKPLATRSGPYRIGRPGDD